MADEGEGKTRGIVWALGFVWAYLRKEKGRWKGEKNARGNGEGRKIMGLWGVLGPFVPIVKTGPVEPWPTKWKDSLGLGYYLEERKAKELGPMRPNLAGLIHLDQIN
ncbi:hypothetical protein Droror1_Dr00024495 [Drosera rotundifolia]